MAKTIENLFVYLLFCSDALIILTFLFSFKISKKEIALWAIVSYCLVDLIVNSIAEVSDNNLLVRIAYSFFTAFEYSVFSFILWLNINNRPLKRVLVGISIAFLSFLIGYYLTSKPRSIDSIPIGIETILILLYSFYYLYEQMNDTSNLFIYSKYQFWLITGIMIYLAGSFFIYIFANQVDRDTLDRFWFLTMAFSVIKNMFFAAGVIVFAKRAKKTHSSVLKPYLN